jgi:hypothetical protein
MNLPILRNLLIITLLFAVIGGFLGIIGLNVLVHNEQTHGASYLNYDWELLSILSIPGDFIVERNLGYDYRLGEIRYSFWNAVAWNSAFYAATAAILFSLSRYFSPSREPIHETSSTSHSALPRSGQRT